MSFHLLSLERILCKLMLFLFHSFLIASCNGLMEQAEGTRLGSELNRSFSVFIWEIVIRLNIFMLFTLYLFVTKVEW